MTSTDESTDEQPAERVDVDVPAFDEPGEDAREPDGVAPRDGRP